MRIRHEDTAGVQVYKMKNKITEISNNNVEKDILKRAMRAN